MPSAVLRYVLAAGALIALPISAPTAAFSGQTNAVVIKNFDFSPMLLTVKPGATVTWKNLDGEPHTVTSADGLFRSGALDTNETYSFRFNRPGTYKYVCTIHPRMTASIVVR